MTLLAPTLQRFFTDRLIHQREHRRRATHLDPRTQRTRC